MKSLVTGATGFLGGALAEALVQRGQEVRILARQTSNIARFKNLPVEIRYGSVEDRSSMIGLLDGVDVVYNSAGLATDWAPWDRYYQANVQGPQHLLEAAHQAGCVKRFVHISTTDVYGYPVEPVDETYPITDVGLPYNRSKGLGEKALWRFAQDKGLPVTVIRPADIYGPRSLSIVVEIAALLLKRQMMLVAGGRTSAGLLYIDNAVEAILQAASSPRTIGQAYNLRDESNESWKRFVDALAAGLGAQRPWINLPSKLALALGRVCEVIYQSLGIRSRPLVTRHAAYLLFRDQGYCINKAQRDFGFRSTIGFDEGMKRTLTWLASEEGRQALGNAPPPCSLTGPNEARIPI
jgi:nucleoside-diphosphate-sugar epimerase